MFVSHYCSLVCPQLEYLSLDGNPYLERDMQNLQRLQRLAKRLVTGLARLRHDQRPQRLPFPTLAVRWQQADLVPAFNILRGRLNIPTNPGRRGHPLEVSVPPFRSQRGQNFFVSA